MKPIVSLMTCVLLVATAATTSAQVERPLGKSHFTGEVAAMLLQHRDSGTDDGGVYLGLAGYGHVGKSWYLGGEIGTGTGIGFAWLAESSSFMPLEANVKRAFALTDNLVADLGTGLSYNRVSYTPGPLGAGDADVTDWVFGGQVKGHLWLRAGGMLLGLGIEYQLTADVPEVAAQVGAGEGWDYSNLRIGLQLGFLGAR